jgi:amino acid adenylation domain-containing protein
MCKKSSVYELFHEHCLERPGAAAVVIGDKSYSYRELSRRIDQICHALSGLNIIDGGTVAVMPRRNIDLFSSIFAAIKSGMAYIPVDYGLPAERKKYMTGDVCAVLTERELYDGDCANVVYLDEIAPDAPIENIGSRVNETAYIIFTSGSTGTPKGVEIKNDSLVNLVNGISERIDFSPGRRMTSFTTISFDMFVVEGIVPLCRGMTLIFADERTQTDPRRMARLIEDNGADIVQMTSSRMRLLIDCDPGLECMKNVRTIMTGAEAVPVSLVKTLRAKTNARIYNMYGPTETTVWSSIGDLTSSDRVDIGTPILNTQFHILDESLNPVPDGETGEICISGAGLAAGYWRRPDLTAERFMGLPSRPETRVYRTGDLGRRLPDGAFECLGRMDNQIKLRGYRIELEEIESAINSFGGVSQSLVSLRGAGESGALVAFYAATDGVDEQSLREHIAARLPLYMRPSVYLRVDEFSYTPNGKLDRKRDYWGDFVGDAGTPAPVAGGLSVEDKVLGVVRSEIERGGLAGVEISLDSSLASLGVDSLSLARVIFALERAFSVEFDLGTIVIGHFTNIRRLADYAASLIGDGLTPV